MMPKIDIDVSWGRWRERKLRLRTLYLSPEQFCGFLRTVELPQPATRRRRRKGKGCKARRKLNRDRAANSVRVQDAGVVNVEELTGCGSGADVGGSGDSILGDRGSQSEITCPDGESNLDGGVCESFGYRSVSSSRSRLACGDVVVSTRTVRRPSVLSPRPSRVAGVGGHGGTRPELQVFESSSLDYAVLPVSAGAGLSPSAAEFLPPCDRKS